jgi:hypothetical protein
MINKYAMDLARQMGIELSSVTLSKGQAIGYLDARILSLCAQNRLVIETVHKSELDSLYNGPGSDSLELKVRSALVRLTEVA